MERPKRLYKYQSVSVQSLRNLKRNSIYFSSPINFNDPYDCLLSFDYEALSEEIVKGICIKSCNNGAYAFLIDRLFNDEITRSELVELYKMEANGLLNFDQDLMSKLGVDAAGYYNEIIKMINDENIFNIFKKEAIGALSEKANFVVKKEMENIRNGTSAQIGVCCFSEVYDSLLMWAYYADGHKGFCLEFDTSDSAFAKIHKVEYIESIPKINPNRIFNSDSGYNIELNLMTKSSAWNHEREWRAIHKEKNKEYIYGLNALLGVYFGANIDLADLEIICLIVKGQNPNAKFYRMQKDEEGFKFVRKEITYASFQEAKGLVYNQIEPLLKIGITNIKTILNHIDMPASEEQKTKIVEAILDDIKIKKEGRR